jgi:hypothetical protein
MGAGHSAKKPAEQVDMAFQNFPIWQWVLGQKYFPP